MRRSLIRLTAACGISFGMTTAGFAEDFNPFAVSSEEAHVPTPASIPEGEPHPIIEHGEAPHGEHPMEHHGEMSHEGEHHGEMHHEDGHHGEHEHHMHHAHHGHHGGHHGGHHEHEEKVGNIRVTPLFREIESGMFDQIFDDMYSVNVGTTFWQPEHHYEMFSTQVGLVTEFQYSSLDAKDNVNINSVVSVPFGIRENLRVTDADLYAGNIGLSFVINTYLPDSHNKLELGFTPVLTIGNLSTDLVANTPTAGQTTIVLDRGASDNGTFVGGDFRLWAGIQTEGGFRAGLTGFYGVGETDAIFDSSQSFDTYGGGFYVEMPTRFVPHEFPAPIGTFQWFEEIFGLH